MDRLKNCAECGCTFGRDARFSNRQWIERRFCSLSCAAKWNRLHRPPRGEEQFWAQVSKSEGCWVWAGSRYPGDYGRWSDGGRNRTVRAHRRAWELTNGPIPDGLLVCHRCDNPSCVRPDHLFTGTQKDNMQDAARKGRIKTRSLPSDATPATKLTWEAVRDIRHRSVAGEGNRSIADSFGLHISTIQNVVAKRSWRETPTLWEGAA